MYLSKAEVISVANQFERIVLCQKQPFQNYISKFELLLIYLRWTSLEIRVTNSLKTTLATLKPTFNFSWVVQRAENLCFKSSYMQYRKARDSCLRMQLSRLTIYSVPILGILQKSPINVLFCIKKSDFFLKIAIFMSIYFNC